MGQKTNPNILRLAKTRTWNSQYFEKKSTETAVYAYKDLEIRQFIDKFFKDNGLLIHNCKLHYMNEDSLHIFVSYYLTTNSVFLVTNINKQQNIRLSKSTKLLKRKYKSVKIKKGVRNFLNYQKINYNKVLNKNVINTNYKHLKKKFQLEKNYLKPRRVNILKYYKRYLAIKSLKSIKSFHSNSFLEKFFESLRLFFNNKINIFLTLKQLNKDLKQKISLEKSKLLKKRLIHLKKYKSNNFFNEGTNTLFLTMINNMSSKLLAYFIATQLKKLKRHNFFLKFLKTTLTIFKNSKISKIKGIKIKIKGRLNGAPRARQKVLLIGNGVPVLSLNSNIDYSEETAFTSNGTFGVKVWIHYLNNF